MRETKIICNECGADMTKESGALVEQAITAVKGVSFTIERRIAAISRLDDGADYDICQKCREGVLRGTPVSLEYRTANPGQVGPPFK